MKTTDYSIELVKEVNPFKENKFFRADYDGKEIITNEHLMFLYPNEIPQNWLESKTDKPECVPATLKTFPPCEKPTRPLALTRKQVYFDNGSYANKLYFFGIQSVYPNAEWFAEKDFEGLMTACVNGQIKAYLMTLSAPVIYPLTVLDKLSHLKRNWYEISGDGSEIITWQSVTRPPRFACDNLDELKKDIESQLELAKNKVERLKENIQITQKRIDNLLNLQGSFKSE